MGKRIKRVGIIADLHSGHLVGLTPPRWQLKVDDEMRDEWDDAEILRWEKWAGIEKELWTEYTRLVRKHSPLDLLIVNADSVDGKGEKSGGTELITTDRIKQSDMAADAIARWGVKKVCITYGTPYHTGIGEDFENLVADKVRSKLLKRGVNATVKIGSHEWPEVNGLVFDVKHAVGSSSVPHGRHTAVAKDHLWNVLWSEHEMQPKAHVLIRSHVHYFDYCGGAEWLGMTTPALQGMGSKFGARKMSGTVDWGMVMFEVESQSSFNWWPEITRIKAQQAKVWKI